MIKILLFARLQEVIGKDQVEVEKAGSTVSHLKEWLQEEYAVALENTMTAINEQYAYDDEVVQEGDTIAFIPPVSGG